MRIRSKKQMWLVIAAITTGSILLTELCITVIFLGFGPIAFVMPTVIVFGALIPLVVSVPVSYIICHMGWQLSKSQSELQQLADTDPLTGLINRRHFFEQASLVLAECAHEKQPVSLLVIDADHFKDLNDTYGHSAGDAALIAIADTLRANFRKSDLICRVGGEEFAVLLPGVNNAQAYPLAERLVRRVYGKPLSTVSAIIEYSISCGIADSTNRYNVETLYKAADDAMYVAKRDGRNRVAPLAA